jgi:hypothetical protein
VAIVGATLSSPARASTVSDFFGIDINVPKGTVTVGRPDPVGVIQRLPQTIQNLPQDVANLANPPGMALAFAVRQAKAQAQYGARPMPANVYQQLQRFFPAAFLQSVRYNTFDSGRITLDGLTMLLNADVVAITLEDIVVFRDENAAQNAVTWAHELTHVQQYRTRGVETFANMYVTNSWVLENEAKDVEARVGQALAANPAPTQTAGNPSNQFAYFNINGGLFYGDAQGTLYPANLQTGQVIGPPVGRVFFQNGQYLAQNSAGQMYVAMRIQ